MISRKGAEMGFDIRIAESEWWIDRPNHHLTSGGPLQMNIEGTIQRIYHAAFKRNHLKVHWHAFLKPIFGGQAYLKT